MVLYMASSAEKLVKDGAIKFRRGEWSFALFVVCHLAQKCHPAWAVTERREESLCLLLFVPIEFTLSLPKGVHSWINISVLRFSFV